MASVNYMYNRMGLMFRGFIKNGKGKIPIPIRLVFDYIECERTRKYIFNELLALIENETGYSLTKKSRKSEIKKFLLDNNLAYTKTIKNIDTLEKEEYIIFNPLISYSSSGFNASLIKFYKVVEPTWSHKVNEILDKQAELWGLLPTNTGKNIYWYYGESDDD